MQRVALIPIFLFSTVAALHAEGKVRFNRDIRPMMSDTCFHCHGPDKSSRKAGLRLDLPEAALLPAKSGEIPIVPGKPEESEVIKRLFTEDADDLMPPDDAHKTLTVEQKDTFKRWVAEGAEYEAHWAYTPLVRPATPVLKNSPEITQPIDAFIAEKLAEKGFQLSEAADRRTLLRRLSLDLIGLPPTAEETQIFLKDTSPDAYEKQVERLLKSPHFGERMAVWWLDVARFTDTVGFHGDQNQRVFPYRDYVIEAFNKNKRFDEFTIEQLAGDLLPNPTTEQLVATGFNRLNMVTREGGAQPKEYLSKYGAERVRTVGGAWLGATLGCSECHDHKFDPFTAKDFYAMQAFFADVKQWGVYADYGYTPNPELKGVNNEYPFFPEIEVESPYLTQRAGRLQKEMDALVMSTSTVLNEDVSVKATFEKWKQEVRDFFAANPSGWNTPVPQVVLKPATSAKSKTGKLEDAAAKAFTVQPDGKILFSNKTNENASITFQAAQPISAIRLELLPDAAHGTGILRQEKAASALLKWKVTIRKADAKESQSISIRHADANFKEPRYSNGAEIIGVSDAWKTSAKFWDQPQVAIFVLEKPLGVATGDTVTFEIIDNAAGCVRVSTSPIVPPNLQNDVSMANVQTWLKGDNAPENELLETYLVSSGWNEKVLADYSQKYREKLECYDGKAWTLVSEAVKEPLTVRVLPRGNWMDETGEIVKPASPEFLPTSFKTAEDKRLTRLELAKWLCSPENPLTPRAITNRWWKLFFGNGLSMIVDDLGAQGEPPSHPELLDWLSIEFRDSGWDMKHMIRLMVTSKTYRQSSNLRKELADIDPNNRLLASQNPRRLDAEFVRDNTLFIAGLLNDEIGGPSVKPYQPPGYYANLQFPSRDYVAETDDRQWRRGVYMHWQRTFLHPMLANFDAPMRDECTASRPGSNTPQQALTLLNDPTFVESARVLATRLMNENLEGDDAKLTRVYELAVARPVKEKEKESLFYLLNSQRELYRENQADAEKLMHVGVSKTSTSAELSEMAAWTTVCRVILNLHETITRY